MIMLIGNWLREKLDETSSLVKAFFIGALDGIMSFWMVLGAFVWAVIIWAKIFGKEEESDE